MESESDSDEEVGFLSSEEWKDVEGIPQDDGPDPVVPINYSKDFIKVMDYFRAILKTGEKSERTLKLTKLAIKQNSANYTAWYFRRQCIFHLKKDLKEELKYCDKIALHTPKNYQLWYHRRSLVEFSGEIFEEMDATYKALCQDSKNYHVWAYRQWLVEKFSLWKDELNFVDELLENDVRNNSAWNHRRFVLDLKKGAKTEGKFMLGNPETLRSEILYTFEKIKKASSNTSPWYYLRGLTRHPEFRNLYDLVTIETESILKKHVNCVPALGFYFLFLCQGIKSMDFDQTHVTFTMVELYEKLIEMDSIRSRYWKDCYELYKKENK